ncbi:MAG: right-handed parallel beta-helix repeat-containing protein, partial [Dokdonella sp.]
MRHQIDRSPDAAGTRVRVVHLAMLLMFPAPTFAATFNVDIETDSVDANPGDGQCADAKGACSLRAAIMESNALPGADEAALPAGHFTLSIAGVAENNSATGDLDVTDDLSLHGESSEASVIDGGSLDRVLDLRAATGRMTNLSNLALVNGNVPDASTGDGSAGAGLRVGAGVHLAMHAVDVRDNHARQFGGAAGIDNFGCILGDHVRIVGNTDPATTGSMNTFAGGIAMNGNDLCLELDDSEISNNSGDFAGALALETPSSITLRRTLIANNTARFAGGIDISHAGDVRLENVTMSGNAGNPGALLNDGGARVFFVNSTITGNHGAQGLSGALADVHGGFGLTFLTNTILAGNGPSPSSPDCER